MAKFKKNLMSDIDKKAFLKTSRKQTPLLKNDGWEDKEIYIY